MFNLKTVKALLKRPDLHKGKLVGGFSILLFALPTTSMLVLPSFTRLLGFSSFVSMMTGVVTAVVLVLGLTLTYAWVAYKSDESNESPAAFILTKSTKSD
ncbi:hypothetical protein MACJ_002059 [Theileria orientalis]|uniref:Uncharacterized protein n=1 Tax=Theileria orientalis TaxID=68886 RepID=A0A976M5F0_THEOR|nr:hypothetical protein MACJ_002059 [Theileria orientalis]